MTTKKGAEKKVPILLPIAAGLASGCAAVITILLIVILLILSIEVAVGDELPRSDAQLFSYETQRPPQAVTSELYRLLQEHEVDNNALLAAYYCMKNNEHLLFLLKTTAARAALHPEWSDIYAPTIKAIHDSWCHNE